MSLKFHVCDHWAESDRQVILSILKHDVLQSVNTPTLEVCPSALAPPISDPPPTRYSIAKPCPEHKGSLCEVFTDPPSPHPPLCSRPSQPLPALPSLWLMCSICWMMDWAGQGKSSHTFSCVHMAGRPAPSVVTGGGGGVVLPHMCHCCVLTSPKAHTNANSPAHPLERQFVPSVHAGHSSFVKLPFPLQPWGKGGRSDTS